MYETEIKRAVVMKLEELGQIADGHKPIVLYDHGSSILVIFDHGKYEVSIREYYGDEQSWSDDVL